MMAVTATYNCHGAEYRRRRCEREGNDDRECSNDGHSNQAGCMAERTACLGVQHLIAVALSVGEAL